MMTTVLKKTLPPWLFLSVFTLFGACFSVLLIALHADDIFLITLFAFVVVSSVIYTRRVYLVAMIAAEFWSIFALLQLGEPPRQAFIWSVVMLSAAAGVSEITRRLSYSRSQIETESDARFQNVVENLEEGLIVTDSNGVALYMNTRMEVLTGRARTEILGQREIYKLFLPPEEWSSANNIFQHQISDISGNYERQITRKDGTKFWAAVAVAPLKDAGDQFNRIITTISDISERKQVEKAFVREHTALTILMDTIPDGIYYKDMLGRYVHINKAEASELGISEPQAAIGKTDFDFYDASISEHARRDEQHIIATGRPIIEKIEEHVEASGRTIQLATTKVPVYDDNGQISGIVGISRDITRQISADKALRSSEEQMRSLIASINDLIFSIDLNGLFLFYHQSAVINQDDTPLTPDSAIVGKHFQDVLPRQLVQKLAFIMNDVTSTLHTRQFNYSLQSDGQERFYSARISPLIDTSITLIGITAVSTDITETVEATKRQQRLLKLEQLSQAVTARFLQSDDLNDVINDTLARFGQYLGVSRAYVFHFRDNERLMDNTHEWHIPEIRPEKARRQALPFEALMSFFMPRLNTEGVIAITDFATLSADVIKALSGIKTKALLVMPFYVDNRMQGFIGFDETRSPREWLPEEIAAMRTFGQSYATTLERKNAKQALVEARDAAIRSARLKSEFVSNMSHEVRTPMTGLLGMLELLLETDLDDVQKDFAQSALSSGRNLLHILNDILDFSKIEAGQVTLEAISTDLPDIMTDVMTTLGTQAAKKGLQLILDVDAKAPTRVLCDPTRLRQILMNLTSNAIKFTASGSVKIHVRQVESTEIQTRLRFEVEDTGIGIATDQLQRIFGSFIQADGSITRKYGGTGLGLAISKQLVELMDSRLDVSSVKDQGSTFSFTLSLPIVNDANFNSSSTPISNRQFLVLDSRDTSRQLLAHQLRIWGAVVTEITSVKDLQAQLEKGLQDGKPIEMIFFGDTIPYSQAVVSIANLRAKFGSNAPIMVCQRDVSDNIDNRGEVFNTVLNHPFQKSDLYDLVVGTTGGRIIETVAGRLKSPALKKAVPIRAHILVVDDNVMNRLLLQRFLALENCTVEVAQNGREALALLDREEYSLVLMDIHMPEMDGLETTRRARALANRQANIPIIAVTASILPEEKDSYIKSGINGVLGKPFSLVQLRAVLNQWLPAIAVEA
jgi:PAS domain S-box-containing protein